MPLAHLPPASFASSATRHVLWTIVLLAAVIASPATAQDPALPDRAEERFLQQLMRQQFFDLARNYCEQQIERATTTEQTARWQLRIGEIYATQAWMSGRESRNDLLTLAIEKTTTYLQEQTPGPEDQFLLRIQQAELLSASVRMGLVVDEGGRLFARRVRNSAAVSGTLPQDPPREPAVDLPWQQSLTRSEELLRDLEKQLGTLKRELDSRQVLQIRDRLKRQLLQTRLLRWQVQQRQGQHSDALSRIDGDLDALARSTRVPQVESQARLLLAELTLVSGDTQRFDLLIRAPRVRDLQQHWTTPTFLKVRSALSQQDPTTARRLLDEVTTNNSVQRQQQLWLELECRLGERELAEQLRDPQLLAAARQAFARELTRTGGQLVGVFRDAAAETSRRYQLVEEVGVQIADVVQTVEREQARGNVAGALRLIDRTLTKLPPTQPASRAALLLRGGELQLNAQQWPEALARLQQATDLFAQGDRQREQATADLLRIFCLSRLAGQSGSVADRVRYERALEQHLQQFAAQPTAAQARQWLLLAVRERDQPRAAALTLEIAQATAAPREKLQAWNQFVAAFESALRQQQLTGRTFPQRDQLEAAFRLGIRQLQEDPIRYPPAEIVALLSLQLVLDFTADVSQRRALDGYESRVRTLRQLAAGPTPLSDGEQQQVLQRLNLLDVIIAARTTARPEQLDQARRRLLTSAVHREEMAAQLSRHIDPGQEQNGDIWLAGIGLELMTPLLSSSRSSDTETLIRQLPLVQKFTSVAQQPELHSRWIGTLLQRPLTDAQTMQVASVLASAAPAGPQQQQPSDAQQRFWTQVLAAQPQGSDLWLTSQLRLAEFEIQAKRLDAARRRVGVVDTLYPDWGHPNRKQEAERLKSQLR